MNYTYSIYTYTTQYIPIHTILYRTYTHYTLYHILTCINQYSYYTLIAIDNRNTKGGALYTTVHNWIIYSFFSGYTGDLCMVG